MAPLACRSLLFIACVYGASSTRSGDTRIYWPQDYERAVAKWQEIVPDKSPSPGISIKEKPPFWDLHWHVYLENGRVVAEATPDIIENHPPLPSFDPVMSDRYRGFSETWIAAPVDDGWIVAFDFGEWGAAVYWFSKDGSRQYEIADKLLNQFLFTPEGLFASSGFPDVLPSPTELIRFERNHQTSRWRATTLAKLDCLGCPMARLKDGILVFLGRQAFHSYSQAGGIQDIPGNLVALAPNDSKLYAGGKWAVTSDKLYMAEGWVVMEFDLRTRSVRFFVPDSRFVNDFVRWDISNRAKEKASK